MISGDSKSVINTDTCVLAPLQVQEIVMDTTLNGFPLGMVLCWLPAVAAVRIAN